MPGAAADADPESAAEAPRALDPAAVWRRVREIVEGKPSHRAMVESVTLDSLTGGAAVLLVRHPTELEHFKSRAEWFGGLIAQAMGGAAGAPASARGVRVEFRVRPPSGRATGDAGLPMSRAAESALVREAEKHPLVRHAMDLFDARIVDVRASADD